MKMTSNRDQRGSRKNLGLDNICTISTTLIWWSGMKLDLDNFKIASLIEISVSTSVKI